MQTSVAGKLSNVISLTSVSILSVSDAVRKDDEKACLALIRRGIDLNQKYGTYLLSALLEAASLNRVKIISHLIKGGADLNLRDVDGRTPLMWASRSGHREAVEILLRKGASPLRRQIDVE